MLTDQNNGSVGRQYMTYDLPHSPTQVIAALEQEQRDELDAIIRELEEENR
jgi:hypothetical protein